MAIVPTADYETFVGASSGDTLIGLLEKPLEQAIRAYLGYDPVQSTRTEYYPLRKIGNHRHRRSYWELHGDRAVLAPAGGQDHLTRLQLRHLPIRGGTNPIVYEDAGAEFGEASGAFGASTQLTWGTEFWADWRGDDGAGEPVSYSGALVRDGAWQRQPGSIKVTYIAGYTADELDGTSTATGIDASQIRLASLLEMQRMYSAQKARQTTATGVTLAPGAVTGERMGDYSYTLDGNSARELGGMQSSLSGEAAELLHPFRNLNFSVRAA